MLKVYGSTLKALVHEQFGDGIISAINFKLDIKSWTASQAPAISPMTASRKMRDSPRPAFPQRRDLIPAADGVPAAGRRDRRLP